MPHRFERPLRDLLARRPLARVDARLNPVELGEDVVWEVERTVREDVALGAAQDPKRRYLLVRGRDLLGLAAQVVGVKARHDSHVSRVVADRQVLVAAVAPPPPSRGRMPCRPTS